MAKQENKGTIYQQLNKLLNLDGFGFQDAQPSISQSTPAKEGKIIIKGNSPEEIHRKGLELEQKRELQNKFFRTTDRGFQKALQYEAARLPLYIDFESMEYYPIISSALDLFMEEATTIGLNGKMLNIFSNKERIKSLLEEFFYDIVNVNVNLPFWARNVCKYGDNFALLYGERKKGITHVKQLVNYEIERFERIQNGKPLVKFKERMTGDEFNTFEIAHFRLLGDDKFLPYGSCLLSDTRIKTSNGVKQIKDIQNGDVVVGFDIKTQKKIETKVLDTIYSGKKNAFKISTKHNYIGSSKEHKFLIYDNKISDFRYEFVENLKIGDNLIVNNYDDNSTNIKINKQIKKYDISNRISDEFIIEPIISIENIGVHDVYDIYVDNENHNFYANNIVVHNSVLNKVRRVFRQLCVDKNTDIWCPTGSKKICNLNIGDEIYSYDYENSKVVLTKVKNVFKTGNKERILLKTKHRSLILTETHPILTNEFKYKNINEIKSNEKIILPIINGNNLFDIKMNLDDYYSTLSVNGKSNVDNITPPTFIEEEILSIEKMGIDEVWDLETESSLHNFIANGIVVHNCMAEDAMLTYRIIRAGEKKVFKIDVGNIDEDDIEDYIYKVATKFKKVAQVAPNDGQIDYRFNILGNDEDYFLPVRNANTQTGIDTLQGASNLDAIADIEYLRDNLFTGLGIPKPFLSFQDAAGAGKNMAQYDIRFAKKIVRIQQALIQELNKMAIVHLYLLGYDEEDLKSFELTLTNPSTQQELMRTELLREKAQTYSELTRGENGIAAMSHTKAKRLVFNMSDKDIVEDLKQQKMEKVVMQELADAPVLIKKTGLFADIDKKFGQETAMISPSSGSTGGEMPSAGSKEAGTPPMGGGMPAATPPEFGRTPASGDENLELPPLSERMNNDEFEKHVEKMVYENNPEQVQQKINMHKKIINENNEINNKLNYNAQSMINEIDELLSKGEAINTQKTMNEAENVNIEDIENIEITK